MLLTNVIFSCCFSIIFCRKRELFGLHLIGMFEVIDFNDCKEVGHSESRKSRYELKKVEHSRNLLH